MISIKDIKSKLDSEYGFNIAKKTRVQRYADAKKVFCLVCFEYFKDIGDIAEELNMSRCTVSGIVYRTSKLREEDARILSRVRQYFKDYKLFTTLNGYKIKGKTLNNLMIELSTWNEDKLIEFIDTDVKQFKRENFI